MLGYHTLPRSERSPAFWLNFWDAGHAGVTLFFILSGFVLVYTYGPARGAAIGTRAFLGARVARLYPVYLAALVIGIPEYLRMIRGLVGIPAFTLRQTVLVTVTTPLMLQAWLTGSTCRWNCPSWTLSVEALFYLLFPLLAPLLRGRSARALLGIAAGCVAVIFAIARLSAWSGTEGVISPLLIPDAYPHWPVFRLPEFLLGMAIGRWYSDRRVAGVPLAPRRARGAVILSVVAIGVLAATHASWGDKSLVIAALTVPFAVLVLGLAEGGGHFFARPAIVLLGEASYAVYIIHAPLHVYILGSARRLFPGSITEHPWPIFVVYLGTVLAVAVLLYQYLERPARRALRRRLVHSAASP